MKKLLIAGEGRELRRYVRAAESAGMEACASLIPRGGFDGLLLPGSFGDIDPALYGSENMGSLGIDRALDEKQLELAERFIRDGKPVFGICKGMQLLNIYFGGGLVQDIESGFRHRYIDKNNEHGVDNLPGGFTMALYGPSCRVNSTHHQAVGRLGGGLRVCSVCPEDGIVEAFCHESLPVFGVQWHPEQLAFERRCPGLADGGSLLHFWRELL